MINNINYQKLLDSKLKELTEKNITPTLLLHSCCAPCSSYVLEYLSEYFKITVHYYNPNITDKEEYEKIFNDWVIPLGGRPLQFTTNSYGQVLPIHPHPYIYIKRKGGKL